MTTMTTPKDVQVPKWVFDLIQLAVLAPYLKITAARIQEIIVAAGEPATRLEVFILSYLRRLIPRSEDLPLGVGFASNDEAILQQLLENLRVTQLQRFSLARPPKSFSLESTPASLGINISNELNRRHNQINRLDLFHIDMASYALSHDTVNLRLAIDQMDSVSHGYLLNQADGTIRSRYYSSESHLFERFPNYQWFAIVVLALFLHKHEADARTIPKQVLHSLKRPSEMTSAFISDAFEDALKFAV